MLVKGWEWCSIKLIPDKASTRFSWNFRRYKFQKLLTKQEFCRRHCRTSWGKSHRSHKIRMWLLNKFISFLAVLSWKTGLKENVDKEPSGAHIFQASAIPSNGYTCISSTVSCTDFLYYTAQWWWNVQVKCLKVTGAWNIGQGHWVKIPAKSVHRGEHYARYGGCRPYSWGDTECQHKMCQSHWSVKYRSRLQGQGTCQFSTSRWKHYAMFGGCRSYSWGDIECWCKMLSKSLQRKI